MNATCWRALATLVVATAALFFALPALGADSLSPASVDVTLLPGQSTKIDKTLHLDALPGAADIVLAVDTTASMCGAIGQAQAEATSIVNDVQAQIPGARFAVVDFRDYPFGPFGDPGDWPYLLRAPLTSSAATVQAAISAMACGGGNDGPEAYNRTFFEAVNDPALLYNPNAVRFLVVLGDNIPHDPDQSASFSNCPDTSPVDPGRDAIVGTSDDIHTAAAVSGLAASNDTLLMISYGSYLSCYDQLTAATGGTAVAGGGGSTLSSQIVTAINTTASHIDEVDLAVSAGCPLGVSFDPSPPYGPFTAPVDISFGETITAPSAPGVYSCTVTAVVDGTARAVENINVTVPQNTPGCKVTDGGRITASNGDKATLGGVAKVSASGTPSAAQEYQDHGPAAALNVHSTSVLSVTCSGNTASILGTATVNGSGSISYRIDLTDNREPGAGADTYRIRLGTGYDSGEQTLVGGNIQIH